jgi:hypothetical protein
LFVFVQFSEISDITAKDIFHMAINAATDVAQMTDRY